MRLAHMRLKNYIRAGRLLCVCLAIAAASFLTANHNAGRVTANLKPQDQAKHIGVLLLPAAKQKGKNASAANEIQLAIMSTPDFDATQVDPASVVFAGALVVADTAGQYKVRSQDVDGDGLADLIVTLNRSALQVGAQAIKAHFIAQTRAGDALVGVECLLPSGEPCFAGSRTSTAQPVSPGTPSPTAPAANFSENFDGVTAPALPT